MIRIHIMNSVKGGSGKSTTTLYLANYLRRKKHTNSTVSHDTVIIDLDVCGSSWSSNYENFMENKNNCIYLNDLFYDYDKNSNKEYIFHLNVKDKDTSGFINVVMADAKRLTSMKDETLDVLESTVFHLVNELYVPSEDIVTDIIFDMPPGYEKHSEQIIRHLIMDMESKLYDDSKREYEIYLYMLSNFNEATYISNLQYVNNLYVNNGYSMSTDKIKKKNIVFVLNDINGITERLMEGKNIQSIMETYQPIFDDIKNKYYGIIKDCKVSFLFHSEFEHEKVKLQALAGTATMPKTLEFQNEISQFESLFDNMYGGGKS